MQYDQKDILTDELPILRAKIGIKQEELSDILGIRKKKDDIEYVYFIMFLPKMKIRLCG